jgi:hypothetical protein
MDALNTLRAILVGFAAVAATLLAVGGQWLPAAVMLLGILAHGALWLHLFLQRRRDLEATISGFERLLADR